CRRDERLVAARPAPGAREQPLALAEDRLAVEPALEILRERARRIVPALGLLGEAAQGDGLEIDRDRRLLAPGRRGIVREDLDDDLGGRLPREGRLADQQLVERGTEPVDVGPPVRVLRLPARLLRRYVLRRPDGLPRDGEPLIARLVCDPEVDHV